MQHAKMVHGLASRLRRELSLTGDLEDLIAFGFSGLVEAKHRFDPRRGVGFRTFAYHRVRGAMLDGVRKMSALPRRAHERLKVDVEPNLTAAPRPIDRTFARISANLTGATPLQSSYGDESPESVLLKGESISRLLSALPRLASRERLIVRGYYFEGRSLDALAQELGISRSWASRIHGQALARLRAELDSR